MKKTRRRFGIFMLGLLALVGCSVFVSGCTITRQLSAAEIIKKTDLKFEGLALDSIAIYPDLFPKGQGFLPDPQVILFVQNLTKGIIEKEIGRLYLTATIQATNGHENTLCLRDLKSVLKLDTIVTLPVDLKDSMQMVPGENKIVVNTIMPIDGSLFHLLEADTLHFVGRLSASLPGDTEIFPLEFAIHQYISPEEKEALVNQARQRIVDFIVDRWLSPRKKAL